MNLINRNFVLGEGPFSLVCSLQKRTLKLREEGSFLTMI